MYGILFQISLKDLLRPLGWSTVEAITTPRCKLQHLLRFFLHLQFLDPPLKNKLSIGSHNHEVRVSSRFAG